MGATSRLVDAVHVAIAGESAGGLAVYLQADHIASLLKPAGFLFAVPLTGFVLDAASVTGAFEYQSVMTSIFAMSNATITPIASLSDAWRCQMAPYVYPLNSMFDSWQIACILAAKPLVDNFFSCNCSAAPGWAACARNASACSDAHVARAILSFGAEMVKVLYATNRAKSARPGNGGALDSCHAHVEDGGSLFHGWPSGLFPVSSRPTKRSSSRRGYV